MPAWPASLTIHTHKQINSITLIYPQVRLQTGFQPRCPQQEQEPRQEKYLYAASSTTTCNQSIPHSRAGENLSFPQPFQTQPVTALKCSNASSPSTRPASSTRLRKLMVACIESTISPQIVSPSPPEEDPFEENALKTFSMAGASYNFV